jgi:hypothetical protein
MAGGVCREGASFKLVEVAGDIVALDRSLLHLELEWQKHHFLFPAKMIWILLQTWQELASHQ